MWLSMTMMALAGAALLALGFWMGRQSSRSASEAADSILQATVAVQRAANDSLDRAIQQASTAKEVTHLGELVQQQTASASQMEKAIDRLDANVYVLLETLTQKGLVRKPGPRLAGETPATSLPPPLAETKIPSARPNPGTSTSSAPPTVTG